MKSGGTFTDRDNRAVAGILAGMGSFDSVDIDSSEAFERLRHALLRLHEIDIDAYGGGAKAAKLLGIKQQRLTNWRSRGMPASALKVCALNAGINPLYLLGLVEAMAMPLKPIGNESGGDPTKKETASKRR